MTLIVSDTTSLIVLEELHSLDLLCALFERVVIPEAVLLELEAGSLTVRNKLQDAACFEVVKLDESEQLASLNVLLDRGEAEAITLALERQLPILIDEKKGRQIARQLKLTVTGFAGVLVLAVRKDTLSAQAAQSLLDQAISNGFRLSDKLQAQVSTAITEYSQRNP